MKENGRTFTVLCFYCMTEVPRTDERLENVDLFPIFDGNIYSEISLGCQGNDTQFEWELLHTIPKQALFLNSK